MNPHVTEFRVTMDQLNAYMQQCHLSKELKWRLREYFHKTRHLIRSGANNRLLEKARPAAPAHAPHRRRRGTRMP